LPVEAKDKEKKLPAGVGLKSKKKIACSENFEKFQKAKKNIYKQQQQLC